MEIAKYYELRETISILDALNAKQECVRTLLETYPFLNDMKMSDVKKWMSDRATEYEMHIQQEMGVREK
jgi:hypothetical protein